MIRHTTYSDSVPGHQPKLTGWKPMAVTSIHILVHVSSHLTQLHNWFH